MPPRLQYDSARGQCMLMLVALNELRIAVQKQEAIAHIVSRRWFDVQLPDDNLPYPSALNREPRWHCLIAWARKDAVLREWMFNHQERDCWQITRGEQNTISKALVGGLEQLRHSLFDAAVDLNPHQIDAALFALRSPVAKGVLLAVEVGLG